MQCGHNEPSTEKSSNLATSPYEMKYIKLLKNRNEYIINLKDFDEAEIQTESNTQVLKIIIF